MATNGQDPQGSGAEWPTVTIAGQEYTLKVNAAALWRVEKLTLNPMGGIERTIRMLGAVLGKQLTTPVEELAEHISGPDLKTISDSLAAALKKAAPAGSLAQEPQPVSLREPKAN